MTDRGEPDEYEVVWKTGHVERFKVHQVSWPNNVRYGFVTDSPPLPRTVCFHAEINGRWTLMLQADEADIHTIRNITQTEYAG